MEFREVHAPALSMIKDVLDIAYSSFDIKEDVSDTELCVAICRDLQIEDSGLPDPSADADAIAVHALYYIFPAVAVYRFLKGKGLEKEQIVECIRKHFRNSCLEDRAAVDRQMRIPGAYRLVPRFFLRYSLRHYTEAAGFRYRLPDKKDPHLGAFDIIRCPYLEAFTRYGCPEITRAFCDSDDFIYKDMHPCLAWERTGTLGYGSECCNFRIRETGK